MLYLIMTEERVRLSPSEDEMKSLQFIWGVETRDQGKLKDMAKASVDGSCQRK